MYITTGQTSKESLFSLRNLGRGSEGIRFMDIKTKILILDSLLPLGFHPRRWNRYRNTKVQENTKRREEVCKSPKPYIESKSTKRAHKDYFWTKNHINIWTWLVKEGSGRFGKWNMFQPVASTQWNKCQKQCILSSNSAW